MYNNSRLFNYLRERDAIEHCIQNFEEYIISNHLKEGFKSEITRLQLQQRLDHFLKVCSSFDQIQTEIESLDEGVNRASERLRIQNDIHNITLAAKKLLNYPDHQKKEIHINAPQLRVIKPPTNVAHKSKTRSANASEFRYNRSFKLPTYDGKYENWHSFKKSFKSAVDSQPHLTDIDKLIYLKSVVQGEAANVIEHIEVTHQNYKQAWKLLQEMYDRNQALISKRIDALLCLSIQKRESAEELEKMAGNIMVKITGLLNHGIKVNEQMIVQYILTKLHRTTVKRWEQLLKRDVNPSLFNMLNFLLDTAVILSSNDKKDRSNQQIPEVNTNAQPIIFVPSSGIFRMAAVGYGIFRLFNKKR